MSEDWAGKEYKGLSGIRGPTIIIDGVTDVSLGEIVLVKDAIGRVRQGRVLEIGESYALAQVFEGTSGLSLSSTRVRFLGHPYEVSVGKDMLGRIFSGLGNPLDGGPFPRSHNRRNINGLAINPAVRAYPRDFIQTGISGIDCLNTLVRGQKIPIFSGSGLPHNQLVAQMIRQSTLGEGTTEFAIIFVAMGIKHDDAHYFSQQFEQSGACERVTMFLNLADDPAEERLITPRFALTLAEYLAFEEDMHVLIIFTDMTNYCEALRELSTAREEIPGRKGYPGYMYTDLASIYERAGRIRGKSGSITQVPVLTMPGMDLTHPVADLTGYITEGQIVLSGGLHQRGIYPPLDILPSLSRLMKDGIGPERTRKDHANLASQLYASYAEAKRVRSLATIIGEEELSEIDQSYLRFARQFENKFINQDFHENRSIEETLNQGWKLLAELPHSELHRITEEEIAEFYPENYHGLTDNSSYKK